mgnify:FL=1
MRRLANGDNVLVMETNIDDQNPQIFGYVMDRLFAAGALDVWMTPIIMKKNRPAVTLSVMAEEKKLRELAAIIFAETTAIGLRYYSVNRITADRIIRQVTTPWGEANVKVSSYEGKVCTVTPEYDDCAAIASQCGLPLKYIQQQVVTQAIKKT